MRKRLFISSLLVAVVGLVGAGLIYLTAPEDADSDENVQIVVVDGQTYRIPLSDTKMYRRELERFGGQAAVLLDEFNRWFTGLWRGRSLAITLAWITGFASLGLFLLARQMPADASAGDRGENRETG